MKNRVFFPQAALDEWLGEDRIDLLDDELTLKGEGRRFKLLESIRVIREVTAEVDPHELVGRVKTRGFLTELGAEILEGSMVLGDNAYDVVPGFIGSPVGTFEEHQHKKSVADRTVAALASDEELLASFLLGKL